MTPPTPSFRILIKNFDQKDFKDATADLTPYLLSIRYVDNLTGKADELHITIDNTDYRFLNRWYLGSAMTVQCWIGQMYCGEFEIDQPEQMGPPHVASFRAQSAEYNGPIRIPVSFMHYNKTLAQIIQYYANKYNLKQIGTIPDLNIKSITQLRESDINFLHRIAIKYGCNCSIKGGVLLFDSVQNAYKAAPVRNIHFANVKAYHFITDMSEAADAAVSNYYDPDLEVANVNSAADSSLPFPNGIMKTAGITSNNPLIAPLNAIDKFNGKFAGYADDYNNGSNIIKLKYDKAESTAEGQLIALGAASIASKKKHKSTITVYGDETLVAGNSINLLEFGKRSGYWLIESSTHSILKKGGYVTVLDLTHGGATTQSIAPASQEQTLPLNTPGGGGFGGSAQLFTQ